MPAASPAGLLTTYAFVLAFEQRKRVSREKLTEALSDFESAYVWGWVIALDAYGLLSVEITGTGTDDWWDVSIVAEHLVSMIHRAAKSAPDQSEEG